MEIEGRKIGIEFPPYIIAEMSNNHLGSIERAKKIIESAKKAGADAVKVQTYDADSLTIDCNKPDFIINSPLWKGKTYYQLYKESALPLKHTKELFDYARDIGISIFSSPFSEKAVDLLMKLDCPAFKIASFEAIDLQFLKYVAQTNRPVLMSTGISNFDEIEIGARVLKENNVKDIMLFHCISQYPAEIKDSNLSAIHRLKMVSDYVGLSDHSLDETAALSSVSMGACAIEKHFTLSRKDGGPDAAFSIEEDQMRQLKIKSLDVWTSIGSSRIFESENRPGKEHARSLYIICDVKKGEQVSGRNIRSIRPGYGLSPFYYDQVLNKLFRQDFEKGTALKWEYLS